MLHPLTITSQCIFSKSCFASRDNARFHTQRAVRYSRCLPRRFFVSRVPLPSPSLDCPLCEYHGSDLPSLTAHLTGHWTSFHPRKVQKNIVQERHWPLHPPRRQKRQQARTSRRAASQKQKDKGNKGKGKGSKKGGGGGPGQRDIAKMIVDMNKLLLSHDDSIVSLESMQLLTFIVPSGSPSMEAGEEEGKKYHEMVTSMSKEELKQVDMGRRTLTLRWQCARIYSPRTPRRPTR